MEADTENQHVNTHPFRIPTWLIIAAGIAPAAFFVSACDAGPPQQAKTPVYRVKIVKKYRHDPQAFSQGLVVDGHTLIEGTGQLGESELREVNLQTGRVTKRVRLHNSVFGEGVTVLNDKIYQLTWKKGIAYVYDRKTLKYERMLRYHGEGWGLTHNGKQLIMSNGSSTLKFLDPNTFQVLRTLKVREGRREVIDLNELEVVNGELYANVWHKDFIAAIDMKSGKVKYWVDLRLVKPPAVQWQQESVLNGIAWDAKNKKLYVTGKDWPALFEIKVIRPTPPANTLTKKPTTPK